MTPDLKIREGSLGDLDIILHHRKQMFIEMGHEDDDRMVLAQENAREFFTRGLTDGTYRSWLVVDKNGTVVAGGGIAFMVRPSHPRHTALRRADIVNMYTEPPFRRTGIARALMETMISWCKKKGFEWVTLHASEFGRPLYESLGFKPTTEMRLEL